MKVLHLSTSDTGGGAAKAAWRLHKGLLIKGIDSSMFVRDKISDDPSVTRYNRPSGMQSLMYKLRNRKIKSDYNPYVSSRPAGCEVFSDDRTSSKLGFSQQLPEADLYHLHWISGFIDLPSFFHDINKPVIWTLHDMSPFTGGCHYSRACKNYLEYCHSCPDLGSKIEKDLSFRIFSRKEKAISGFKNKLLIRADSNWLANEAKNSKLFHDFNIDTIHYGIETDEFIPRNKKACRKALNIPESAKGILFGAPGIDNPRKGFKQLEGALLKLENENSELFLISFGAGMMPSNLRIPWLNLGHVSNNNLLSLIYNCADFFVIPSLQEAFGQTALEAMSCGIPVIGFNTGGIPDIIDDKVTGHLVETGNVDRLAEAIKHSIKLNKEDYLKMADACRQKVIAGFKLEHQSEKYMQIYSELL